MNEERIEFALGTAQWSGRYGISNLCGAPEFHDAVEMLEIAQRAGITTLDTARGYGESEALIGAALEASGLAGSFEVVTKLDATLVRDGTTAAQALANAGRSLAHSREALRRDVLDVVLFHRFAHLSACEGVVLRRLLRERENGAIRALGVSAANPHEAWAALELPEVEVIQVASSLFDQRLSRRGFFEAAAVAGKRVFVRSVFLQGIAFMPTTGLPRALRGFEKPLHEIRGAVQALETTTEHLFLAYAATLEGGTPVLGCESPDQLRGLIDAAAAPPPSRPTLHRLASRILPLPDALLDPSKWKLAEPPPPQAQAAAPPPM
ncbi:MAG: aldo/keto reductase [Myxococcota bacterium]|nr:aldo/keto reductase [Myxococcota bacterium]